MDMNTYVLERFVESKLDQLRADAARSRLLGSLRRHPRGLRSALAVALLRAGRRLSGRGFVTPRTA
ncbi:MAG TPA: hypothetical protein VGT00_02640 [Methylomirabilota bacterium]|jgi:hypothetical protein|nr:hypothetical protein [Methylomirabilota bacterium]